jgi:hypothetical protein
MTGTGIKTNGIGQKTTSHLNLTVTLKPTWDRLIADNDKYNPNKETKK